MIYRIMSTPRDPPLDLIGAIVAHNEETTIGAAIHSLAGQDLGGMGRWRAIWVVASGCTDRTVERVREQMHHGAPVHLIEEPVRMGKGHALNTLFERAQGDLVILLNGDAYAEPGALRALLARARGLRRPFAVMARPIPPPAHRGTVLGETLTLLWRVHEELHRETLEHGEGNHLSDELLLLSLPVADHLSESTINDGAYLGALLERCGGDRRFAEDARVRIQVPASVHGYLLQRRRIYRGHVQVARETGVVPTTLLSVVIAQPRRAWHVLTRCWKKDLHRERFPVLIVLEALALLFAVWDGLPPRRDHVRWKRVPTQEGWPIGTAPESSQS